MGAAKGFARFMSFSRCGRGRLQGDHILRACCVHEDLEVFTINADALVREAQRRHQASPTAAAVLGRLMMGTVLMNSVFPQAHTVKINLVGIGPIGYAKAVSTDRVFSKAMVQFPQCQVPLRSDGKVDMKTAVGDHCELHIIYEFPQEQALPPEEKSKLCKFNLGSTYEIAEALAFFMRKEEQVDTVAALGVTFNGDGIVNTARGFMIQVHANSDKASCNQLLKNISNLPSLCDSSVDMDGHDLISRLLRHIALGRIDEPITPKFGPCNYEALLPGFEESLLACPFPTLQRLIAGKEYLDVVCIYTRERLRLERALLESALRKSEESCSKEMPEEKWLDFQADYVGKTHLADYHVVEYRRKPLRNHRAIPTGTRRKVKSKYSYDNVLKSLPPISPFPIKTRRHS